jgi:midasin
MQALGHATQEQAKAAAEQQQRLDRGDDDGDDNSEAAPVAAPTAAEVEDAAPELQGVEGEAVEGDEAEERADAHTDDVEALRKSAAAKRKKGDVSGKKQQKPAGEGAAAMETDAAVDDIAANADAWMAQERLPEELELPDDSMVTLTPASSAAAVTLTPAEVQAARDAAERELERWRQPAEEDVHACLSEADVARGQAMWQRYETLTAQLSIDLAEQLRLVLEPTMASKLQVGVL